MATVVVVVVVAAGRGVHKKHQKHEVTQRTCLSSWRNSSTKGSSTGLAGAADTARKRASSVGLATRAQYARRRAGLVTPCRPANPAVLLCSSSWAAGPGACWALHTAHVLRLPLWGMGAQSNVRLLWRNDSSLDAAMTC